MVCKLKDIAEALNVSINTVSRALQDKKGISPATRERIKQTAKKMGYVHNLSASGLRTGKTKTVAVVYGNYFNPYYTIVSGFLNDRLSLDKYNLLVFTDWNAKKLLRASTARQLLSNGIDAVISFLDLEKAAYELLKRAGKQIIVIGRESLIPSVDSVVNDDYLGGYLATKHLIEKGHRDILLFSAEQGISCARLRQEGYKQALTEAGIAVKPENIFVLSKDGGSSKEFLDLAKQRGISFTAIFCFNDLLAYEAIKELKSRGLQVPRDVSIVGHDFLESHLLLPIGLTSIDAKKEMLVESAVETLLARFAGNTSGEKRAIAPPVLVEGETVRDIASKEDKPC